jgi:hypothetical protein
MAEPTVDEMLANVRSAINDALVTGGAVEITINGRTLVRNYTQLLEIEQRLMQRQASTRTTGSQRTLAEFGGRPS